MTGGVLVIGYGNALRTDDGIGWHVAERLADDARLDGVMVIQRHQLTPELALDISRADLVVLIDASQSAVRLARSIERMDRTGSHEGFLVAPSRPIQPSRPCRRAVRPGARGLRGPRGGGVRGAGDRLTPLVEAALPRVVEAVAEFVADRAARPVPAVAAPRA